MSSSQSRHVYTREQRAILEASFACKSHPDIHEKERLANLFNCNLIQISNWFQNHRRRVKKQQKLNTTSIQHQEYSSCDYYYCYYPSPQYAYSSTYYPQQSYDPSIVYYNQ